MDVDHIQTPSTVTEGGVKGAGEGGTIAAPAAVVNAVAERPRRVGRPHAPRPEPRARADPGGSEKLIGLAEGRSSP